MPKYGIGPTPVLLAQSGMEGAVLTNVGNSTIYADRDSAVSSGSYGFPIAPRSSLTWGTGNDLWVVCAPGENSELAVMYGTTDATLSEVSAVVTGDVTATIDGPVTANISGTVPVDVQNAVINADVTGNIVVDSGEINVGGILTPVSVQGGGEVLLSAPFTTLPSGTTQTYTINPPASGITYYGLHIDFADITTGTGDLIPLILRVRFPGSTEQDIYTSVLRPQASTGQLGRIGEKFRINFIVPVTAGYPVTLLVSAPGAPGNRTYSLQVDGIAQSLPYPVDGRDWVPNGRDARISLSGSVAGDYVIIAPSFIDRIFRISVGAGTSAGRFNVEGLDTSTTSPAWIATASDVQLNWYGAVPPTNGIVANSASAFIIPGNGRPHRVTVNVAPTGSSVGLEYAGRVST